MSVYTNLTAAEVSDYLNKFELGEYSSHQGISAGVENTNFFVETVIKTDTKEETHRYVLTLFEQHNAEQVKGFIQIGRHLAEQTVPVPGPIADQAGVYLHELKNKPAILCPCLPGSHPSTLTAEHCHQIGAALARFHLAGKGLEYLEENDKGLHWWPEIGRELMHLSMQTELLTPEQQSILMDEIEYQESNTELWYQLPRGLIHGDLFHDNVLFESYLNADGTAQDQLRAILDIYNACEDAWLFDLAIVANDWCADAQGQWKEGLLPALFKGYQSERELTEQEQSAWGMCLRAAALRFWLSRLVTQQHQADLISNDPLAALITTIKDPMEYFLKLMRHRETNYFL